MLNKILFCALITTPLTAFAYDHAKDFKLHPEADIICSSEGALIAIDDDALALGLGDRETPGLLPINVTAFVKRSNFEYDVVGVLEFRLFASDPMQKLTYMVKVATNAKTSAREALVTITTPDGDSIKGDVMSCDRK